MCEDFDTWNGALMFHYRNINISLADIGGAGRSNEEPKNPDESGA